MRKVVAIVQARMRSSRLPGKILLDLGGKTALEQCLLRARAIPGVSEVVLATCDTASDDPIARVATRLGFCVTRGSETDVLARFAQAARESAADVVVRITSDCPLLDPAESGRVVEAFLSADADYASNVLSRRLPRGLDTEVLSRAALDAAARAATAQDEREHVTLHIYRRPESFRLLEVTPQQAERDLSAHRWTLDTVEDYCFLHALFEELGDRAAAARTGDILSVLEARPAMAAINAGVTQKPVG